MNGNSFELLAKAEMTLRHVGFPVTSVGKGAA